MLHSPFLPGLLLALAAWILPLAVYLLPGRIVSAAADRAPWLKAWAPWAHGAGFPYFGLLLGWISARDYGLVGHTAAEWVLGGAAAVVLGVILGWMSIRFSMGFGWGVIRDETRWTLYRAAAWPWTGFLFLSVLAAFFAACLEFAWGGKFRGEKPTDEAGLLFLLHAAASALLFLLAHNLFLAMLMYLTAVVFSTPDIRLHGREMIHRITRRYKGRDFSG
jgi:hypothetical protein